MAVSRAFFSPSSASYLVPLYFSLSLLSLSLFPTSPFARQPALSCHFGSPRGRARLARGRPQSSLPIVARRVPPRQGKQCLISVNAAIMAVSSLHRSARRARGTSTPAEREISEICAGTAHRRRPLHAHTRTHTHAHTSGLRVHTTVTGALDYRLLSSADFITAGDPRAHKRATANVYDYPRPEGREIDDGGRGLIE